MPSAPTAIKEAPSSSATTNEPSGFKTVEPPALKERFNSVVMTAAAMPILFWDVETRSALDLGIASACRYASDPSTEVLCVGFAVDDGEPQIWIPGKPSPEPFVAAASDSSWKAVAHNYQFERAVATRILEPRHGFQRIPLAQQWCSMTLALANALPGELEAAALALGLPYYKDREGYRLMRQMARLSCYVKTKERLHRVLDERPGPATTVGPFHDEIVCDPPRALSLK